MIPRVKDTNAKTYMSWNLMFTKSSALKGSERSIAVSIVNADLTRNGQFSCSKCDFDHGKAASCIERVQRS